MSIIIRVHVHVHNVHTGVSLSEPTLVENLVQLNFLPPKLTGIRVHVHVFENNYYAPPCTCTMYVHVHVRVHVSNLVMYIVDSLVNIINVRALGKSLT